MKFTDTRGLHLTREKCMARIEEMVNSVNPTLPEEPNKFWYKCDDEIGIEV